MPFNLAHMTRVGRGRGDWIEEDGKEEGQDGAGLGMIDDSSLADCRFSCSSRSTWILFLSTPSSCHHYLNLIIVMPRLL